MKTKSIVIVALLLFVVQSSIMVIKGVNCKVCYVKKNTNAVHENGTYICPEINNTVVEGVSLGDCITLVYPDRKNITIWFIGLSKLINTKNIKWSTKGETVRDEAFSGTFIFKENNNVGLSFTILENYETKVPIDNEFKIKFKVIALSNKTEIARDDNGFCTVTKKSGEICKINYLVEKVDGFKLPIIKLFIKRERKERNIDNSDNNTNNLFVKLNISKDRVNIYDDINVFVKVDSSSPILKNYLLYGNSKYDLGCYGKTNCLANIKLTILPNNNEIKVKVCNQRQCKEVSKKLIIIDNYSKYVKIKENEEKIIKLEIGKFVVIDFNEKIFPLKLVLIKKLINTPYVNWSKEGYVAIIYFKKIYETWNAYKGDEIIRNNLKFKILDIYAMGRPSTIRYDGDGSSPGCMETYGNPCMMIYPKGYVILKITPINYVDNNSQTTDKIFENNFNNGSNENNNNEESNEDELPPLPSSEKIKFTIYRGWNLISNPSDKELTIDVILSNCKLRKYHGYYTWYYNSRTKKWEHPTIIPKDSGVYIYSESTCTIELEGEPKEFYEKTLYKGWNLISVDNLSWNDIKGNCKLIGKIWEWDPITKTWKKLNPWEKLNPWRSYWVKVEKTCKLFLGEKYS